MEYVLAGETAVLEAWLFDEDGETPAICESVSWSFIDPDGTQIDVDVPVPAAPTSAVAGATLTGMTGTYQYVMTQVDLDGFESMLSDPVSATVTNQRITVSIDASAYPRRVYRRKSPSEDYYFIRDLTTSAGSFSDTQLADDTSKRTPPFIAGDNFARLNVEDTSVEGSYNGVAKFLKSDGTIKYVTISWMVEDPLAVTDPSDGLGQTIDLAWAFLEDCFDSEEGGPWLRDASLRNFSKHKMMNFVGTSLYEINQTPPFQAYTDANFPYATAMPLLSKGVLIETIKHLMRSYVEQPEVVGAGQISYFDRRNYLDRWKVILDVEMATYKTWLLLFKRQEYAFGRSKVLVDIKSGRRLYDWPNLRLRYPRVFW